MCVETRLGADAEVWFLGDLAAGKLIAGSVRAADWIRIAELVAAYRDLPLGTVDASVVATAERLASWSWLRSIAGTSRSCSQAHAPAFEIVP